jgi:hypothetical protein
MDRMLRLIPLLLLTGCCVEMFAPDNSTVRIYEVTDIMRKLRLNEEQVRDRLDMALGQEGYSREVKDIQPQKGMLVIRATPRGHTRIQQLLVELGL